MIPSAQQLPIRRDGYRRSRGAPLLLTQSVLEMSFVGLLLTDRTPSAAGRIKESLLVHRFVPVSSTSTKLNPLFGIAGIRRGRIEGHRKVGCSCTHGGDEDKGRGSSCCCSCFCDSAPVKRPASPQGPTVNAQNTDSDVSTLEVTEGVFCATNIASAA
jgi:hypothetical protein